MTRYFMHLRDGSEELIDPDGVELASPCKARALALRAARDVIGGDVATGRVDLKWRVDVEDAHGALVHSVAFRDTVTVVG